ncbi:integrase, catalytic region, zinc finger, CCHC-type containing protein [Tanacetum coccineum]|uniref:Integrase, catalytic region, zinc finger, CCHC-type containing protein n=1 Tax=Tanacetum coccineum TaxID=301880 RepID=A0ABQ5CI34_9ASTR
MASNEKTNAAGTDTRPPLLVEIDYDSWRIRIPRYFRGKPNGKLIWKSIQNGPTPHPLVTDPPLVNLLLCLHPGRNLILNSVKGKTNLRWLILKLKSFSVKGLPRPHDDHLQPTQSDKHLQKEIWIMRKCIMQDQVWTIQLKEGRSVYEHERFPCIGNESNSIDYIVLSTKLVNDMKITQLEIPTHQMNTKFVNNLPSLLGTHATVHDGHIVTEPTQRKAPGNVGNTGARGKKVICYNCRGEGHVARQCKEQKRKMDSQYFKDKALLMEAKEKGDVLDAEAEAFLADVECTAPYDQPQALTTTNMFQANHEDAYDSDVDEGPNAAVAFMANLSSTSATNSQVNEVHSNDNPIFDNVDYQLNQEMHQEEHLDSDAETEIDDNTIPYHQYLLDTEAQNVPTEEKRNLNRFLIELEAEYEQCVLDNKNLTIEKKNLLIKNDCLIAECLEKDICSIVLTSDIVVPPSSNCLCDDLRSACDREHTKVLELEAEVFKQQKMVIESGDNLQGKDDTIRNLETQINITRMLNVGSTEGSCDQQALETDRIQLKDTITSLRIQLDGLKVENVSLKRRYDELSKANTHSRTANTEKLSALTAENTKLKAQVTGKTSSGPSTSEKPKVLASGIYNVGSKYIPPPKRANWVKPSPLPKKKQVTFQEPHRTSTRPTQKPPVQQNKKPNVSVNLPTRTKPATEPRKPMPKSDTRNHRIWPSKSENARRAAIHNRNLNFDHNQFVIRSLKSVNTKTPQAKHNGNHTKKVWKATRKHNVNTTKTAWRPKKVVGSVKPQWRPTGRHFGLFDTCPLTRIVEPIVEPLELTPSVSSSSKVTMISRFTDCKLSDRKAGSKGLSVILWNAEERDVVPPGDPTELIAYSDADHAGCKDDCNSTSGGLQFLGVS